MSFESRAKEWQASVTLHLSGTVYEFLHDYGIIILLQDRFIIRQSLLSPHWHLCNTHTVAIKLWMIFPVCIADSDSQYFL